MPLARPTLDKICPSPFRWRNSQDLWIGVLRGLLVSSDLVGSFDEFAVDEDGAGTDERYEVWRVDSDGITMRATMPSTARKVDYWKARVFDRSRNSRAATTQIRCSPSRPDIGHLRLDRLPSPGHRGPEQLGQGRWLVADPFDVTADRLQHDGRVRAARSPKLHVPV